MFADELRAAIERAPRITLPSVTALLWRAYGEGRVSEAEAEALSALIEARRQKVGRSDISRSPALGTSPDPASTRDMRRSSSDVDAPQDRQNSPRRPGVGSRPRTDASMERRRRWAASGRLPPALAARFTLAEQSVLALVAAETVRRKDCRLAVPHLAAIAGVAETTVRNAIREAKRLGLLTVEERRVTGFRNLPNVVRIVSPEWVSWLRLARKGSPQISGHPPVREGGGCKSARGTPTSSSRPADSRPAEPSKGCRRAAGDPDRSARVGIRAGGGAGRAMR